MHTRTAYRTALSVAVLLAALVFTWSAFGGPAEGTTGISAVAPTAGSLSSAAGGTIITITGNGFVGTTNVYFNATYAPDASPANGDLIGTQVQGFSGSGHGSSPRHPQRRSRSTATDHPGQDPADRAFRPGRRLLTDRLHRVARDRRRVERHPERHHPGCQ